MFDAMPFLSCGHVGCNDFNSGDVLNVLKKLLSAARAPEVAVKGRPDRGGHQRTGLRVVGTVVLITVVMYSESD